VVFATPERWFALVCGIKASNAELEFGYNGDTGKPYVRPKVHGILSRGCTLYMVSSAYFPNPFMDGVSDGRDRWVEFYTRNEHVPVIRQVPIDDVEAELSLVHPEVEFIR
jgi:hypothetical protein